MRTCIKIYRHFFSSTKSTTKRREATRHREATSQWTTGFTVHLTIMHPIASNYCVLNAFSNPSVSPAGACSMACQRVCSVSFVIPFWNVDILFVQTQFNCKSFYSRLLLSVGFDARFPIFSLYASVHQFFTLQIARFAIVTWDIHLLWVFLHA